MTTVAPTRAARPRRRHRSTLVLVAWLALVAAACGSDVDGDTDDALQVSTVLSLPTALDGLLPMLERATDGDPGTTPSPGSASATRAAGSSAVRPATSPSRMTTGGRSPGAPTVPTVTPSPSLAEAVGRADRGTHVEAESALSLQFPAHHPQGLVRAHGLWWISTVDVHAVEGHLLGVDDDGELVADLVLVDGPRFHPGGIDLDGDAITVPVAEYRADSTTALYRVDLTLGVAELVGRVDDHVGALSAPRPDRTSTAMTWASRHVLTLDGEGAVLDRRPNPSHWIDVQDGQRLDGHRVLWSGIGTMADGDRLVALGGLGIWDEEGATWVHELPLATTVASGRVLTTNPVWAELDGGDVVLHAAPDDDHSTLVTHRLHTAA